MGVQGTITSTGMILLITDTNVLFDVINIGALPEFFSLDFDICTTIFVIEEIKTTDRGATTVWETWKKSDNTYSNCHPMFGTVTEWFYRWLGGIRPLDDEPGFKKFIIATAVQVI